MAAIFAFTGDECLAPIDIARRIETLLEIITNPISVSPDIVSQEASVKTEI